MEEGLFTLWSIAHFLSGVLLAVIFSRKWLRVIEYVGILFLFPLFFIENSTLKIISFVIVIMTMFAFVIEYLLTKRKKLKKHHAFILASLLIFGWELFEYSSYSVTGFGAESLANRIADIVIGFAGFILTFTLLHKIKKSQ